MSPCEGDYDDDYKGCVWCGTETDEHDERCVALRAKLRRHLMGDNNVEVTPAPATPKGEAADE